MTTPNDDVWIGLVELTGHPQNPVLDGCRGAFSNYLVFSGDESEFEHAARQAAKELELDLVRIEWCEPLADRLRDQEVEPYLLDLAGEVRMDGAGRFGVFHAWDDE